jgi:hypothetical protein
MALPIPDVDPVMAATFPFKDLGILDPLVDPRIQD